MRWRIGISSKTARRQSGCRCSTCGNDGGLRCGRAQTQVLLDGRLKCALPGWEEAESRRAAGTATEASWRSHASGSGDGGGLGGDSSWGAGAHLVFNQPKLLPITTVSPPPSQVVRSTPLGMACAPSDWPSVWRAPARFAQPCRCVFAFVRKAATYRCLRAAASWAGSGYSPGMRFWGGLLLS
jgi:hypothetical protein